MGFSDRLMVLRRQAGHSQEQLAEKAGVSRQAVAKWEQGKALPDLNKAIALTQLFHTSLDSLFLQEQECAPALASPDKSFAQDALIDFLIRAKRATYAAKSGQVAGCRPNSHDAAYKEGDYSYLDTYLGGEMFSGQEAVWVKDTPLWTMNYVGRVLDAGFSGDFLKEVLLNVPKEYPYRGPLCYRQGDYSYHAIIQGEFSWYSGTEEIFLKNRKVYECLFHGGTIR